MTAQLFEDALRNEGIESRVEVNYNERKEATEVTVYFNLRNDKLCVINEAGEIDVSVLMRMDYQYSGQEAGAKDVHRFIESLLCDLADLALTVPPENTEDALLHNVGRGRLLPREFVRENLQTMPSFFASAVAKDSPFRNESWFPTD